MRGAFFMYVAALEFVKNLRSNILLGLIPTSEI